MRKLLLATAGVLGATMGGYGVAQAQVSTIPTLMPGASQSTALAVAPAPGTVIVRFGGAMWFYASVIQDSGSKVTIPAGAANGLGPGTYKENPFSFSDFARFYPSVDGVAANGLQYGALIEIRHEQGAPAGGYQAFANTGSSASANDETRGGLYVRREYAYFGMPMYGTLRMGSTDGPSGLFETGTFENFNDGGWNGTLPNTMDQSSTPVWPFQVVGNYYTLTKAVYLSPSFSGFDFGAAYAPNTGNVNSFGGGFEQASGTTVLSDQGNNFANPGSDRLSSTSTGQVSRLTNEIDIGGRYRGSFGPVGLAVQLGYIGSSHVNASINNAATATRYNGLSLGDFGATVTVAGLTVGGHIIGGNGNNNGTLKPVGSVPEVAALIGASYTVGPLIVGASVFQTNDAGASGPPPIGTGVGQRRDRGVAAGGTYTLAPGVNLFLAYLYGDVKENGVNLLGDGEAATTHNQLRAEGLAIGTFIRW
jgi:hypothetical protein